MKKHAAAGFFMGLADNSGQLAVTVLVFLA
jgi:hypothetical protein